MPCSDAGTTSAFLRLSSEADGRLSAKLALVRLAGCTLASACWSVRRLLRATQMFGEPFRRRPGSFVSARTDINGIVAAFDFQQAFGFARASEGASVGVRRHDRIAAGEDHQQGAWRDQIDEPAGRT